MREILFRGKRVDNGEWVYGFIFHCSESDKTKIAEEYPETNLCYLEEVIPDTVGQYTGQADKTGTKIFEGDIVCIIPEDENAVIKWDVTDAMFEITADGWCAGFTNYYGIELEVIGNIHDNPELLG